MNSKNEVSEVNDLPNVRPLSIRLNIIKIHPKVNHIIAKPLLLLLFFILVTSSHYYFRTYLSLTSEFSILIDEALALAIFNAFLPFR